MRRRRASRLSRTTRPRRFVIESGKLIGMEFDRVEWYEENGKQRVARLETLLFPCDDVILAIGQENAFPWIERDIGIEFDEWDMPRGRQEHVQVHSAGRVLRRRCGVGTGEHHLGRGARAPGGDLHPQSLPGHSPVTERPAGA